VFGWFAVKLHLIYNIKSNRDYIILQKQVHNNVFLDFDEG
jgi:hypothetical protein